MSLSRSDAAHMAEFCIEAGRPKMAAEIILKSTDLDDAKRRLAASDPKAIARADMLKRQGVTEEQVAVMRAARAKAHAARTPAPPPPRSALDRYNASQALRVRQAVDMALAGSFPGAVR